MVVFPCILFTLPGALSMYMTCARVGGMHFAHLSQNGHSRFQRSDSLLRRSLHNLGKLAYWACFWRSLDLDAFCHAPRENAQYAYTILTGKVKQRHRNTIIWKDERPPIFLGSSKFFFRPNEITPITPYSSFRLFSGNHFSSLYTFLYVSITSVWPIQHEPEWTESDQVRNLKKILKMKFNNPGVYSDRTTSNASGKRSPWTY
jgi:hypothetical protein